MIAGKQTERLPLHGWCVFVLPHENQSVLFYYVFGALEDQRAGFS